MVARHGLEPKKALGQNFLYDLNLTGRIALPLAGMLAVMLWLNWRFTAIVLVTAPVMFVFVASVDTMRIAGHASRKAPAPRL